MDFVGHADPYFILTFMTPGQEKAAFEYRSHVHYNTGHPVWNEEINFTRVPIGTKVHIQVRRPGAVDLAVSAGGGGLGTGAASPGVLGGRPAPGDHASSGAISNAVQTSHCKRMPASSTRWCTGLRCVPCVHVLEWCAMGGRRTRSHIPGCCAAVRLCGCAGYGQGSPDGARPRGRLRAAAG